MSTVLDHHQDPNYEPSQTEIIEYGKWLGMELPADEPLLWVAREGLKAPLPDNWKACKSEKGELYYFNFKTGQSIWDHPLDEHYKQMFKKEKSKLKDGPTESATEKVNSKLPPSGKKAPAVAVGPLSSGPLSAAAASSSTAVSANTPTTEDEASSTTSADSTKRGGKLAQLKTLKVRKEVPEELRIDAVGSTAPASASSLKSTPVLTPQSTNQPQSILVPAVKVTHGKSATPQQLPVESPDDVSSSVAPKFSPIATIDTPSNVVESTTQRSVKQATVYRSPSNEQLKEEHDTQLAALQRQHKEQLEEKKRQNTAEMKQFQAHETQRMEKEKEEFTAALENAFKKTKAQLRQRHEQQVQGIQKELDAKLSETHKKLDEEYHNAKKHNAENHSQRLAQLAATMAGLPALLGQDVASLIEAMSREVSESQKKFASAAKVAQDETIRAQQNGAQAELEAALRALKTEEAAAAVKVREVQGECNAKVTLVKMECEAKLQDLKLQLAEEKSALLDAHRLEMVSLSAELKAQQRQTLLQEHNTNNAYSHRSPLSKKSESPKKTSSSRHDDPLSAGSSSEGEESPPPLPKVDAFHGPAELHKPQVAPLSTSAVMGGGGTPTNNNASTGPSAADLRTLMTDVLRELFHGSPFIVPSPGSQQPSNSTSPIAQTVRERVEVPDPNVPVEILKPTAAAALNQSQVIPDSYKEQLSLVEDERRRLEEGKTFVATQRASLEERRTQLRVARRNWKADVMAAKALGVQSNSKKGQLLHKVHRVLDKQAAGLEHDDNLLRESEQWLKAKEQRLLRLESQMTEQHERSRHGQLDISSCSIDTTALFTGYFKPNHQTRTTSPAARVDDAVAAAVPSSVRADTAAEERIGPSLTKALERIERRIDRVATMVSERPQKQSPQLQPVAAAAAMEAKANASIRPTTAPHSASNGGAMSASIRGSQPAALSASARGRADGGMSSSTRGRDQLAGSTRAREQKEAGVEGRSKSAGKRSSRSNSRHRHVDFAAPSDMFADPWGEVLAA